MLYCNHCYAKVVMGADNAPATACIFCKQTIKNPVELTEYAGLVAQQKHKKINALKNMLGALYYTALFAPLIIHILLILSQRPHEFYDYRLFPEMFQHEGYRFMRSSYLSSGVAFLMTPVFFYCMTQNMVAKLDYIKFKKIILYFAMPLAIICGSMIYWESLSNVEYFPFNPSLALLDTGIKIVQLLILCLLVFIIMKLETVYLAFRGMHFLLNKKNRRLQLEKPEFLLVGIFIAVLFMLIMGIHQHFYWYKNNVYDWETFVPPVSGSGFEL